MFRLGLTGSIATGKSTTARLFRHFGVPVHDADAAVHQLYAGAAAALIGEEFPGTVRDGCVDRKALGARVAGKPERFAALERIVHPLVRKLEQEALNSAAERGHRLIVLDIPLLFESGAEQRCDAVLVTDVAPDEQYRRAMARPGMTEVLFHAILARQMPATEKRRRAHAILDSGRGVEAAAGDVRELLRALAPALR
jgi:dephospho-CoA kinase